MLIVLEAPRPRRVYVVKIRRSGKVPPRKAAESCWVLSRFVQPGVKGHSLCGESCYKGPNRM
jgi:hypothetical protein